MNFFGNDPFDEIVREFFGRDIEKSPEKNTIIKGESEERDIDFIEDEKKIYIIFELPGYNEKDISVIIKGRSLEIKIKKQEENLEGAQDYLIKKLTNERVIQKTLPNNVKTKNFDYSIKNGVLEIVFNKK
ncbi:MAG: Hsp20/alpha crystallin family protein [Nanoarchaeota archaeon]